MLKFLFSRFVQSIIVFFLLSIIIFSLIDYMPGDPLKQFKRDNPDISEKEIDDFKKKKGLDKSFIVRYLNYMCRFLPEINFKDNDFKINWNFGISSRYQVEVSYLLKERIITTLNLTIPVFILSLIVAIPIGIFSAVYQYSKFDYLMSLFTFIGISLPTFWLGLMLIYIFSLQFQVFPASGIETINVSSFIDQVKHFVLPIFVLSIHRIGSLVRFFRGSLLDVLKLDYIRTARAKGLSEDVVIFKHALKNAMIPLLTILALSMPHVISGALITEQIFGIPGMGELMLDAIKEKDIEIAMTSFLFLAILTLIFNLLADLLYGFVDPRIKKP